MKKIHDIEELKNFYKTYNRLPQDKNKENGLYQWMNRERNKGNGKVIEFMNSVGYKKRHKDYTISDLIDFYKINNRLPNQKEKGLYKWMSSERKKGNEKVIKFLNSVGYEAKEIYKPYTISDLINFYKSNNKLPSQYIKEEKGLYKWMSKKRRKGNKEDFNEVKTFLDLIDCKDKSIEAKEILESILKQI